MNISDLNELFYKKLSERISKLRKIFILSYEAVAKGTGLTGVTIKKIEESKGTSYINSIIPIINFYGINHADFFNFSKPLPSETQLRKNMIAFHKEHNSTAYEVIFEKPDLIDLIELRLLDSTLFDTWVTDKDVFAFCKKNYKISYTSIPNTLDLAVKKGFLIREPSAKPKQYKKKL
ncbi:hypothetical protein SAMN05216436_102275 [bacterium A37T11]|nr:hypothetical protein SAMN05216436_102275 [bacterium A37T11]